MASENEALIKSLLEGQRAEFIRFLASIVRSNPDAEDLFQAGALRAIEKSDQLTSPEAAKPWLLSLFRNSALDHLRLERRNTLRHESLEEADALLTPTPEPEMCSCGNTLIQRIPQQYAEVLQKVDVEGASVKDFAVSRNTLPNTISVRLKRARLSLRRAIEKYCDIRTLQECQDCECDANAT